MQVDRSVQKDYDEAVAYLCRSKHGAELVTAFERTNATIKSSNFGTSGFNLEENVLYWDLFDMTLMEEGIASPAMTLAHEMHHAVTFKKCGWNQERWEAEEDAAAAEARIQRDLGEPVRHGYEDGVGIGSPIKVPVTFNVSRSQIDLA